MHKSVREFVKWAEGIGWKVDALRGGTHKIRLIHPSGAIVQLPDSPSDYRWVENTKAQCRRLAGVNERERVKRRAGYRPARRAPETTTRTSTVDQSRQVHQLHSRWRHLNRQIVQAQIDEYQYAFGRECHLVAEVELDSIEARMWKLGVKVPVRRYRREV